MLYPDLGLIRSEGLANQTGPRPAGTRIGDDSPCRYRSLPSWRKVFDLNLGDWQDLTREVWNQTQTQELLTSAGRCLEQQTGWNLAHSDVSKLEYFFVKVDDAAVRASNTSEQAADRVTMKYSVIFADCAADYAAVMQAGLEKKRPAAVERNRELLTAMARELAQAGYVP